MYLFAEVPAVLLPEAPHCAEETLTKAEANGARGDQRYVQTGCFGLCALGPIMIVYRRHFYSRVTIDDIPEIVGEHLLKGRIVDRLVYNEQAHGSENEDVEASLSSNTAFYKKQKRVALRNCGVINEKIDEYIAMDGYFALAKVLFEMTPDDVIQTVLDSGLRGRGGRRIPDRTQMDVCKGKQVR